MNIRKGYISCKNYIIKKETSNYMKKQTKHIKQKKTNNISYNMHIYVFFQYLQNIQKKKKHKGIGLAIFEV